MAGRRGLPDLSIASATANRALWISGYAEQGHASVLETVPRRDLWAGHISQEVVGER